MSLDPSLLETRLRGVLAAPYRNAADAKRAWADAYHAYASGAEDVSGDALASSNPLGFRSALQFVPGLTSVPFVSSMEAAFQSYWNGAVFDVGVPPVLPPCPNVGGNLIFGLEASSVVTLVTPMVMFAGLMALLASAPLMDLEVAAREYARVMHVATSSAVLVLISGLDTTVTPGPLPITNTCHLV